MLKVNLVWIRERHLLEKKEDLLLEKAIYCQSIMKVCIKHLSLIKVISLKTLIVQKLNHQK